MAVDDIKILKFFSIMKNVFDIKKIKKSVSSLPKECFWHSHNYYRIRSKDGLRESKNRYIMALLDKIFCLFLYHAINAAFVIVGWCEKRNLHISFIVSTSIDQNFLPLPVLIGSHVDVNEISRKGLFHRLQLE